jgi:dTMP kinase
MAVGDMIPHLTIIFDLDPDAGLTRITATRIKHNTGEGRDKGKDRIEQEDIGFHCRVREGFLSLARENPRRYRVIPADQDLNAVADDVWQCLQEVFGFENP